MNKPNGVLKHYGVKGMKWHDHKYADEGDQSSENEDQGAGGEGESEDGFIDTVLESLETKIDDISDSIKKMGHSLFESLIGSDNISEKPHGKIPEAKDAKARKELAKKSHKDPSTYGVESQEIKKLTNKQKRERLKKMWKNVPNAKMTE